MDEIVRCVDALLLSAEKSIATPANWPNNHADQVSAGSANVCVGCCRATTKAVATSQAAWKKERNKPADGATRAAISRDP
jgi:hypothetical protein